MKEVSGIDHEAERLAVRPALVVSREPLMLEPL
jgi:hypothetical protein